MAKRGDLRSAIGAVGITSGTSMNLKAQPRYTEDGIKIVERIEVAEITARVLEAEIVGTVKNLGAAQRIGETLPE